MLFGAAVTAAMLGAEPQCTTDYGSCVASYIPNLERDYGNPKVVADMKALWCNTTTWMVEDYCFAKCPMRLVVTDPPELRTWMCAQDNHFEPYAPEAHIDLYHPLNNKVLDFVAVGSLSVAGSRQGCVASDYAIGNKSFAGKIAFVEYGGCGDSEKAVLARQAGAVMMFTIDYWPYYWWEEMRGSSAGIENMPVFFAVKHEMDYIFPVLDRGLRVQGKVQYECDDMPVGYLDKPEEYPWDRCPENVMDLHDVCTDLQPGMEPLCEVCTVELQLPDGEKLCMFGNNLRPRKRSLLMHTSESWDLPYTTVTDELVYTTELPNEGCAPSDFAGLRGKIVLIPETGSCTLVMSVRNAEDAGVKAYVMVSAPYELQWYRVRAYSHHTEIPVHTVDYHSAAKLQALVDAGKSRHMPGVGHALDGMVFSRGVPPPPASASPAPLELSQAERPQLDDSSDFKVSGGTAACIAIICIDVVLLAGVIVVHHRTAVQLPHEVRVTGFAIPLKVLSTGLSLAVLLTIALVTFSLATVAGQESTDNAMENGRAALGLSYSSSSSNTLVLSEHIRALIIDGVLLSLKNTVLQTEARLTLIESLFHDFDGSWAEFNSLYLPLFRIQRDTAGIYTDPLLQIFTTRGFFMNQEWLTDDRPDSERGDGVTGSVAETQEGWRYGFSFFELSFVTRTAKYISTMPPIEFNLSRVVAGNFGDPILLTTGKPIQHTQWVPCKPYVPLPMSIQSQRPISAYRPLYGGGKYHGTIEAYAQVGNFIGTALDSERLRQGNLENMSVLVIDDTDKAILGSHNIDTYDHDTTGQVGFGVKGSSKLEGLVWMNRLQPFYGVHYMHEHPSLRVAVLSNYLDEHGVSDGEHAGEFNQQDFFREQEFLTLARITPDSGRVVDTGSASWQVEMRDGQCGSCVVYDDQLRKEVMVFDGHTTLHIYRNLTRQAPVVAKSKASAPGEPWRSRYEVFNEAMVIGDGSQCVSYTFHPTATQSFQRCMLRPDITSQSVFSVSLQIRPDVAYTDTSPSDTTPRLLADSLVGEGNMRLFANGQLYLLVLKYGCRTQPYPGGFPVRAWTTVLVVAGGPTCRVYVNGTLHSEGIDARTITSQRIHGDPYRSGQYFQGRIDNIQLFSNWIPTANEAMSLYRHGRVVREVVSKSFFAQKKPLRIPKPGYMRMGLQWSVAVMIPRADIMRVVDANRMATMADVQIQEANTNKELKQKANATIMIIVAIAMTSLVLFLVFNNMLARPFEQTAALMAEAAVLRIDSIPHANSRIAELRAMDTAIRLMLSNLKLYKSYMPQSVQLDEETGLSEAAPSIARTQSVGSMNSHKQGSVSSNSSRKSISNGGVKRAQMACSLTRRRFAYVVLNISGWHERAAKLNETDLLNIHSSLLEAFLHNVSLNKGVAEVFSGDRFASTFNAAKLAVQHRKYACLCAEQSCSSVEEVGQRCSSSVVCGEGRVGNMGNDSMRRFSFVTPVITWGHALERICSSRGLRVLMDYAVYNDVQSSFIARVIDSVLFPKMQEQPIPVLELRGHKKNGGGDEWMYELQQGDENDPMSSWNKAAFLILRNNCDVCSLKHGMVPHAHHPRHSQDSKELRALLSSQEDRATVRLINGFFSLNFEPFQVVLH